jgi:hypothetical protein
VLRAFRADYATDAGSAQVALTAQVAKSAETAALADKATLADAALVADLASVADEAKVANTAFALQCTGCVGAEQLAPAALAGMASLTADNGFTGANTFAGPTTFGADVAFAGGAQAKLLRLQNSTEDPIACTPATIGTIYYDTDDQALRVCNGQIFQPFAKAIPLGEEGNPAPTCQAIVDANGLAATGNYWVDPDGGGGVEPFAVRCEVSAGEGWFAIEFANSQGIVMAEDSASNPWRKCADDSAKHFTFISESQVSADASGKFPQNHDIPLSYTNPATGQAFTAAQLDAIRGVITQLGADTRMVASTADDDGASYAGGDGGGHEVYVKGTSGSWTLLTPGTNGECGGEDDWPAGGSQAAHYLWHHTAALSEADGWTSSHGGGLDNVTSADLQGLSPGDLLPYEVRIAVHTGGGGAFGWEQKTIRVR